ncbi:hypothetical protein AB5I41_14285 [Sphingomonas sp. MMS24-JH45]
MTLKICNNLVTYMELLAGNEAHRLAVAAGLDPAMLLKVIYGQRQRDAAHAAGHAGAARRSGAAFRTDAGRVRSDGCAGQLSRRPRSRRGSRRRPAGRHRRPIPYS